MIYKLGINVILECLIEQSVLIFLSQFTDGLCHKQELQHQGMISFPETGASDCVGNFI